MVFEQMPEGDLGEIAEMRSVVDDDVEALRRDPRRDLGQEGGISLTPLEKVDAVGDRKIRQQIEVDSGNGPGREIVVPEPQ